MTNNYDLFTQLRIAGLALMDGIYPDVFKGGEIRFNEQTIREYHYEPEQRPQRPKSGSRRSTSEPRQRSEAGQRSSNQASQIVCEPNGLKEAYQEQIWEVLDAYPKTRYWKLNDGLIMKIQSKVFSGLSRTAFFLVRIPFNGNERVRGWGYWKNKCIIPIGPRHTNFPDSSICAFEPYDQTWKHGDSLVDLIDLYTFWAFRQLYLELLDSWPGEQVTHLIYERITEIKDNEKCSCFRPTGNYSNCCKSNDSKYNFLSLAIEFINSTAGGQRIIPSTVLPFISGYKIFNSTSVQKLWDSTSQ